MDWNLADLFELVADTVPERRALAHGVDGPTRSWRELDRNANALARHLARSHQPNDKLAIYAYNRPEFVETLVGAMKARLVALAGHARSFDRRARPNASWPGVRPARSPFEAAS